jgi:diguanylate cyclase (GGDEF)-like protein
MFTSSLGDALARRDLSGRPMAVLLCDVDGFTSLNDGLGQAFGDRVLAEAGRRIRAAVCPQHVVARLGGDEFAVLVEDLDPAEGTRWVAGVAERLQEQVAGTIDIAGVHVSLAVAVGLVVVTLDQPVGGADDVLSRADVAMHTAQVAPGRRPVLHHDGLTLPDARDWQVRPAFERDLRSGSVTAHFQPMVDLRTGRIRVFEALARWHRGDEVVGPEEFLPVAARAGLMPALAEQVMRDAASRAVAWRRLPGRRDLQVAVNVSPEQIMDPTLPDLVDRVLREVGLPPQGLVLEITEESLFDDPDAAARVIYGLRRLGVAVWLDDFGAGYSSLALLHQLPLRAIKLDRALVQRVHTDAGMRRLVAALVGLGDDLGLEVIAEGIQLPAQAQTLASVGCVLGQGYLFAPPGPAGAGEALLRRPFGFPQPAGKAG